MLIQSRLHDKNVEIHIFREKTRRETLAQIEQQNLTDEQ